MKPLPACELSWIAGAPTVVKLTQHLAAPPARVFAAFADAAGWTRWFPGMPEARWLDDSGGGLGKERIVALRGLGRFHERFIAWEPARRFAFTVIAADASMLGQAGEDYCLTAEGTGTRFDWTMGTRLVGLGQLITPLFRAYARRAARRAWAGLARDLGAQEA